jgi:hypothetical protein
MTTCTLCPEASDLNHTGQMRSFKMHVAEADMEAAATRAYAA